MTAVYINYPNPHFSVKHGKTAAAGFKHDKPSRRMVTIDRTTFAEAMSPFINGEFRFAAEADLNDVWLEIDFGDHEFELAIVKYVQRLLGSRYKPLANARWNS